MTGAVILACGVMMRRNRELAAKIEQKRAEVRAGAGAPANCALAPAPADRVSANHTLEPAPSTTPAPTPAPGPTSNPLPPAPRPIQHDSVTSEVVPVSNNVVDACGFHSKAFKECLNSHIDDISKCQIYVDMLKECRKNSGSVFGF